MIEYTSKLDELKEYLNNLSSPEKECLHDLSYPFIPNFDSLFDSSKNRVLLIGQETKGWQGKQLIEFLNDDILIEDIIAKSKQNYSRLYEGPTKRSRFGQFMKKIKKLNRNEPVQWLNFYLFDYKNKSFNRLGKKSEYKKIHSYLENLSIQNLSEQILRLEPKVIFFVGQYHNNFTKLEEKLALSKNEKIILKQPVPKINMKVWNNEILILRVPHPAHFSSISENARKAALKYLKIFDECENMTDFKRKVSI